MRRAAALLLPLALAGCFGARQPARPAQPAVSYVLGRGYEAGGVWYYPHASYNAEQTGLAMIQPAGHAPLTTDGEIFDQRALAAAHQTLQLPAIARVTNVETGRAVVVRVNDRGPADPRRLIAVTKRTAELLAFPPSGVARVRLEVLPAESHAAVDALGGAPEDRIEVVAAPRGAVQATDLPPPGSGTAASGRAGETAATAVAAPASAATPPLRLPEQVWQMTPEPGSLWLDMGSFSRYEFAARQKARAPGLSPEIESIRRGRDETYRVHAGPFADVAAADAALDQALRAGMTDARIVVEQE